MNDDASKLSSAKRLTVVVSVATIIGTLAAVGSFLTDIVDLSNAVAGTAVASPASSSAHPTAATSTTATSSTPAPPPSVETTTPTTTTTRPPAPPPQPPEWLSDVQPRPYFVRTGPVTFGRETFERSVSFTCRGLSDIPTRAKWNLSQYDSIAATFGMDNNAPSGHWVKLEVRITGDRGEELVPSFFVRVGESKEVMIALNGTINFQVQCGGVAYEGKSTGSSDLSIGNGKLHIAG